MSPIIPSKFGHPKYNIVPQKTRSQVQRAPPGSGDPKARRKQRNEANKLAFGHSAEDEPSEYDNYFSRQLAAARFQRNHQLVSTLFNEVVIHQETQPDDHLQVLKRRLKCLSDYQRKIDSEIQELSDRHQTKKLKIEEESKQFLNGIAEIKSRKIVIDENLVRANEVRFVLNKIIDKVSAEVIAS